MLYEVITILSERDSESVAEGAPAWFVSLAGLTPKPQMRVVHEGEPPLTLWLSTATVGENGELWSSWLTSSYNFV